MPAARLIFSVFVAFTLGLAPLLHGLANAAPALPDAVASEHAGHIDDMHQQHNSHEQHNKSGSPCATHDLCNGQCCTACAHSFATVSLLPSDSFTRSVLTPSVQYLVPSSPSFVRERPPRHFSL